MNLSHNNSVVPAAVMPRRMRQHRAVGRPGTAIAIGGRTSFRHAAAGFVSSGLGMMLLAGHALAQATPSTSGIGAQAQNMAQETSTTGGFIGMTAMYVAALICFVGGVWALWQSRQAQNREGGKVAMGIAGLALCGLFATGGVWINKAANSASGGNASVTSTSGAVTFGSGG